MKIILVIILSIFVYPPLTKQDDVKKPVICNIAGRVYTGEYVFNVNDLPPRCDIFTIGQYAFDRDDGKNTHYMESDKDTVRSLIAAKKTVYTVIGFSYNPDNWTRIFVPDDESKYMADVIDPLVNFLCTTEISGILIYCSSLLYSGEIKDLPTKINNFASSIKQKLNNIKIGLMVYGGDYQNFQNTSLFDFSITNQKLDFYAIDLAGLNGCDKDTKITGLSPVTTTKNETVSIEQVTCSVTSSNMDQSKIYAVYITAPVIPDDLIGEDKKSISTYSKYCASTDPAVQSRWCTNPSQNSYDQGAYAKKFYAGVIIIQLDTDDYKCYCECGKFPVSNLIIDGFTATTFKACPKLC